ncbi:hypothetical protein PC116_g16864 [Phytophthora cactorum]|nr:hypothetical protein PC116_g16864 [Phytophthora cactorum]
MQWSSLLWDSTGACTVPHCWQKTGLALLFVDFMRIGMRRTVLRQTAVKKEPTPTTTCWT